MFGTTTAIAAPAYTTAPMTTMAAPMTTMAAPVTTMAAPMTAMAAPMATVAAPTMTTMAAPVTQMASYVAPPVAAPVAYAAPAMTTQTASFVAPPMMAPPPIGLPMPAAAMAPPAQPVSLTAGLPTPEQIAKQRAAYMAALDKQMKEAMDTVAKETEIEKQMVKFTAEKNIALFNMQTDEALVEQLALCDEQGTVAHCELRKALVERNLQLNNQASTMVMDYKMKELVTACETKKYQFAQQYMKEETKLAGQFAQQEAKAHTGTAYAAPAAAV